LEKASQEYFNGEHINCSSCSNDFFYNINSGGVTRTSCDYFPDDKKSHGRHIATNSIMGFWLDELLFCDWDIFQSGNIAGEFHAMSRAISGGPVYCTDDLKTVNYPLLQKLSTSDGRVGRCLDNAKITRNCLFSDIENNPLIRVFNRNRYGYVLAAFNCSEKTEISEKIFLNEIENLPEKVYAVYSTKKGFLGIKNSLDFVETSLKGYEGEIFQLAPVNKGIAVLGLIDKFNSIGFIVNINYANNEISVETMEKGNILIYSDKEIITDSKYAKQGNMYLFNDCNIILLQQQKML
jgi:raffinose synthase